MIIWPKPVKSNIKVLEHLVLKIMEVESLQNFKMKCVQCRVSLPRSRN